MEPRVEKPWGNYRILYIEPGFEIKRVEVNPGHRLSLQKHHKRAEKWTIVKGSGYAVLDGTRIPVKVGSVVDIPVEASHRIGNDGKEPLVFVEVMVGSYFGEDDIVRLEDDYNRK